MPFRRHWLTGELEEFESSGEGRTIIFRGSVPKGAVEKRTGTPWGTDHKSMALAVHPDQFKEFNEISKKHNTGAYYTPDGVCHCPSRQSRAREQKLRGMFDRDAGYGDYAGG